uniref:Aldo_ket_red domain-containing protein n=2 Tax=Caenorhabditis japonica TaxID=281687 RepID=A0A8R1EL37_CAEJA
QSMTDLTLNNGLKLPALGIAIAEGPREDYGIPAALRAGFRHLDLSAKNLNYENVGDVLQWCFEENLAQRKNLFITANFNHSDYERTVLDWRIQKMLIDLNLDYLDMILIEKPIDFKKQEEVFQYPKDLAFELLLDSIRSDLHDKRVLSICYDNFTKNQLAHVIKLTSSLQMSRPQANRLDVTPYFQEKEIREFCRHENIQVMSHHIEIGQLRPIIDGADGRMAPVLEIEEIMRIATELNIKPSQAIIKWIIDSGISLVVRNGSRKRLHLLQDCLKIPLTSEDVQVIRDLDIQKYSKQFCISG